MTLSIGVPTCDWVSRKYGSLLPNQAAVQLLLLHIWIFYPIRHCQGKVLQTIVLLTDVYWCFIQWDWETFFPWWFGSWYLKRSNFPSGWFSCMLESARACMLACSRRLHNEVTKVGMLSDPSPHFRKFNEVLKGGSLTAQCFLFSVKKSKRVQ